MSKLNKMMKKANTGVTVVMFMITKRDTWSINPKVLESRGIMEELRLNTQEIQKQVGERLFLAGASSEKDHRLPDLNQLVDDYWRLRYRRTIQAWKSPDWPIIVTHNLHDPDNDEVLNNLRQNKLINSPEDKVKVVYHPDFINSTNPLFGIDYPDFVRGCNLGIFPSYYEPWGYTPLECIASGVPTVTSNLSGFGDYVENNPDIDFDSGIMVLDRKGKDMDTSAKELAKVLFEFVQTSTRYRIDQRNKAEDLSEQFDWGVLGAEYIEAYTKAINKRRTKSLTIN
jgi:glycogen(starch) synthase